jgi:branched-chain amino acid transport system permease protein
VGGVGEERRSLPPTLILDAFLQHLVNGLVLGGTYALLGIGLTLIFGLMNLVNFAHGEFYTLGAYLTFAALALSGLNFFVALALAIALGAVAGAVCERLLLAPLRGQSIDTTMLVMIGLWIALQNGELLVWGGVAKSIPHPFPTAPLTLGPVSIAPLRVFVVGTALALIAAAWLLIQRTRLGRAMRATFQDRETAALMGVKIARIHTVTFAFGSALAAAAGALLGPVFLAYPSMGDLASLKAFSVVILGGLGNLPGATLGGLILGVTEELGAGYVSSGYRDAVGFVIIILVLLLRPSGLFARAERIG